MTKVIKFQTKQNVPTDEYVHIKHGERQDSTYQGSVVKAYKDTGLADFKYETFTITSNEAMVLVREHYSRHEVDRITQMTNMTNDKSNVLKQKDNVPHSTETLMQSLDYNKNSFYIFMRKLIWHDIVHVTIKRIDNTIVKTIVLNPYLSRRSRIQIELADTFKDISKGLDTIIVKELAKFPTKVNA